MKLIGFIKEYNDLAESVGLDDLLNSRSQIAFDMDKVLSYFEQGALVLGWMGYFIDVKTKMPIAPDSYFTDRRVDLGNKCAKQVLFFFVYLKTKKGYKSRWLFSENFLLTLLDQLYFTRFFPKMTRLLANIHVY